MTTEPPITSGQVPTAARLSRLERLFTVMFLFIVTLNGLSPYIGLKWEFSMNMFADLDMQGANHMFMPHRDLFGIREYYVVESFELPGHAWPEHALVFRRLLHLCGHPAGREAAQDISGSQPATPAKVWPVNGNAIRYQLALLQKAGISARMTLVPQGQSSPIAIDLATAGPEWTRYSLLNQYPVTYWEYRVAHRTLRDYHDGKFQLN